jgi:hypothetical protein
LKRRVAYLNSYNVKEEEAGKGIGMLGEKGMRKKGGEQKRYESKFEELSWCSQITI